MKRLARFKGIMLLMGTILLVMMVTGCGTQSKDEATDSNSKSSSEQDKEKTQPKGDNPIVTITMENEDQIQVELYPDVAPNTVANFISLAKEGYYDGLIFHRVIPGFMIQGGDPEGTGAGGPGYGIKGEFSSNGFDNDLKHERGVISMARSTAPDSAGSQFFIVVEKSTHLDGEYAGFGKVIKGMDAVDKIVSVERDAGDKPSEEQKMKTVEVDTKGQEFAEPEKK